MRRSIQLFVMSTVLIGCADGGMPEREEIGGVVDDDDDASEGADTESGSADSGNPDGSGPDPTMPSTTGASTTGPNPTDTDPTDTDPSDTDASTLDPTETTGEPPVEGCESTASDLTASGFVTASSVFDPWFGSPYEPELAVDGSIATSWFSGGPEEDGTPTDFEWYTQQDHCLDSLTLLGNADHGDPDFQEGFGFGTVVVDVIDSAGNTVYSGSHPLDGTPDPDISLDLGGVLGNRVVLQYTGHESPDCGGFSEFAIEGRAK